MSNYYAPFLFLKKIGAFYKIDTFKETILTLTPKSDFIRRNANLKYTNIFIP